MQSRARSHAAVQTVTTLFAHGAKHCVYVLQALAVEQHSTPKHASLSGNVKTL